MQVSSEPKAVFLVDDHPLFLLGLRALIASEHQLRVCGEATSLSAAKAALEAAAPDVVVTDMSLGRESGLDLIEAAASLRKPARVVVLSMHDEVLYAETALRRGAAGYLMKGTTANEVSRAVVSAVSGQIYVSQEMNARLLQRLGRGGEVAGGLSGLSARELEVYRLLGTGISTIAIAQALHISPKTVESHRLNIKLKLGLSNSTELVLSAAHWLREAAVPLKRTS